MKNEIIHIHPRQCDMLWRTAVCVITLRNW